MSNYMKRLKKMKIKMKVNQLIKIIDIKNNIFLLK